MPELVIFPTPEEVTRFKAKFKEGAKEECWVWEAGKTTTMKYGYFWMNKRMEPAHRVSYLHYVGMIPSGLFVLHPECVLKGEKNGNSKLTPEKVLLILELLKAGHSKKSVSEFMEVSRGTIQFILNGETWSHVTGIAYTRTRTLRGQTP